MSWTLDGAESGAPVWNGKDYLIDARRGDKRVWWWIAVFGYPVMIAYGVIGFPAYLYAAWLAMLEGYWPHAGMFTVLAVSCIAVLFKCREDAPDDFKWAQDFIERDWSLALRDDKLAYKAGKFSAEMNPKEVSRDGSSWSVPLDAVARVESGLSKEWQAVRRYPLRGSDWLSRYFIPDHEYQTFLFLSDGSRRVVQTANADREGSAMLALSIRSWIETHRAHMTVRARVGAEGFAL